MRRVRADKIPRWWPLVLAISAGFAVVNFGMPAIDHYTSPRVGKPCVGHDDCRGHEFCLRHLPADHRYCTAACNRDSDCPVAMSCGDVASVEPAERGIGTVGAGAGAPACIK